MSASTHSAPTSFASRLVREVGSIENADRLVERVPAFDDIGIEAFTTTRHAGSYRLDGDERVGDVVGRWLDLAKSLAPQAARLAYAHQVHGDQIVAHDGAWEGWLRCDAADGHVAFERPTAMAVTLADCVPVFLAHPAGAAGIVHSGWQGTERQIAVRAVEMFVRRGYAAHELRVHCGPAICGRCYEVGPDVYRRLTASVVERPTPVDLRKIILESVERAGVKHLSVSDSCTRCTPHLFFSHRAGDVGRQVGVAVSRRKAHR